MMTTMHITQCSLALVPTQLLNLYHADQTDKMMPVPCLPSDAALRCNTQSVFLNAMKLEQQVNFCDAQKIFANPHHVMIHAHIDGQYMVSDIIFVDLKQSCVSGLNDSELSVSILRLSSSSFFFHTISTCCFILLPWRQAFFPCWFTLRTTGHNHAFRGHVLMTYKVQRLAPFKQ